MPDVLLSDISEFQATPLDDSYPHRGIIIRSNDGTYRDKRFVQNYAWCLDALARGKLDFFGVYLVYWPNWQDGEATFWSRVGGDLGDPRIFVMIDMESWEGKLTGDQSAGANALRESLIQKLGGNRSRVIAYGNVGDLNSLWPDRGDAPVNVADYTKNPDFPNKVMHQFTSSASTPPFPGDTDLNSADGHDVPSLMTALGLSADGISAEGSGVAIDASPAKDEDDMANYLQLYVVGMEGHARANDPGPAYYLVNDNESTYTWINPVQLDRFRGLGLQVMEQQGSDIVGGYKYIGPGDYEVVVVAQ